VNVKGPAAMFNRLSRRLRHWLLFSWFQEVHRGARVSRRFEIWTVCSNAAWFASLEGVS